MKQIRMLIAGLGLLMFGAANATVIDFEDLVGQAALPSNYAGLTWSSGWTHYDFVQSPYTPASGTQRVYQNSAISTFFSFASDVVFDGAFFSGLNSTAGFDLYNNGGLVFSSANISLSSTPTFASSGYSGLVDEVRLRVTNGRFVMDDVTYNSAARIPEPGLLALFGLGFAGMSFARRRNRV